MDVFAKLKVWLQELTEVGLLLLCLSIVAEVLFGAPVPFLGSGVVTNISSLVAGLGEQGVVGLVALGVVLYLFKKK